MDLKKVLYRALQAALLFWINLTSSLHQWIFEVNPYDWCVANKTVDGKKMTVVWYVDNLKIYHVNVDAVDALISQISEKSGNKGN